MTFLFGISPPESYNTLSKAWKTLGFGRMRHPISVRRGYWEQIGWGLGWVAALLAGLLIIGLLPVSPVLGEAAGVDDGGAASGPALSLAGADNDGTLREIDVPILMYHYVSDPPDDADIYRLDLSVAPHRFREQMQYLAEHGYQVVSLYDVDRALRWGAALPPRPVVLTFDDGYRDAFTEVFPVLEEFGYTATFFVITALLDQGHPDYLTWAMAGQMAQAGMSIESHTKEHPNLTARDGDFLYYQIQGSLESIEAHLGTRPRLFCFPGGRWDEAVLAMLRTLGVSAAVTTEGGMAQTTDASLLMRRVRISGSTDLATFGALLRWDWE